MLKNSDNMLRIPKQSQKTHFLTRSFIKTMQYLFYKFEDVPIVNENKTIGIYINEQLALLQQQATNQGDIKKYASSEKFSYKYRRLNVPHIEAAQERNSVMIQFRNKTKSFGLT